MGRGFIEIVEEIDQLRIQWSEGSKSNPQKKVFETTGKLTAIPGGRNISQGRSTDLLNKIVLLRNRVLGPEESAIEIAIAHEELVRITPHSQIGVAAKNLEKLFLDHLSEFAKEDPGGSKS